MESAQDRDHAEATLKASVANVKSLEDSVNAQEAALGVAQANRKQVDVRGSDIATTHRATRTGARRRGPDRNAARLHQDLLAD